MLLDNLQLQVSARFQTKPRTCISSRAHSHSPSRFSKHAVAMACICTRNEQMEREPRDRRMRSRWVEVFVCSKNRSSLANSPYTYFDAMYLAEVIIDAAPLFAHEHPHPIARLPSRKIIFGVDIRLTVEASPFLGQNRRCQS